MLGYKNRLIKVLNGAKVKYIFKEQELAELLESGILVKMLDSETKEYIIRIKPSLRRELLKMQ
jgi:hypothetical protein